MKKQGGFTLIELVVVIVILGILAVTAAPKFINLQDDAKNASLKGLQGAIKGAANMVYARALIEDQASYNSDDDNGYETVYLNGTSSTSVTTLYGYPIAATGGIDTAAGISSDDWDSVASTDGLTMYYALKTSDGLSSVPSTCYVSYTQATSSAEPVYGYSDCD